MDAEETKKKKRVEIDPEEADIVREIFNLYLNGKQGRSLGILEIAQTLNDRCITIRGSKWNKSRIHEVLSNRAYIGEYYFNKREHKTRTIKPESEWILLTIEPIIELATFEIVRIRRESRAPDKVAPRILNSPTLLTGAAQVRNLWRWADDRHGQEWPIQVLQMHYAHQSGQACLRCSSLAYG